MNRYSQLPMLDKIYSISFVAMISGFAMTSAVDFNRDVFNEVKNQDIISGQAAIRLENEYDARFPLKELGVNFWSAIDYTVFSEGRPGLVIGQEGWLFSSEEFISSEYSATALQQNLAFIVWVQQKLAEHQVKLAVSLVPAKARVLADKLGSRQPTALQQSLYARVIQVLTEQDVLVADGLSALAADNQPEQKFFRNDTHWTPLGAAQIAVNTASLIEREFSGIMFSQQTFVTEFAPADTHKGDLLNFLPLTPWFSDLMPDSEMILTPHTYLASHGSDAFFDDAPEDEEQAEVVLIGTSYSANPKWNFSGALKQSLSVDVENLSMQGEGPMVPMIEFLNSSLVDQNSLKLVVWEIPERYMLFDYSQYYVDMQDQLQETSPAYQQIASLTDKQ